MKTREVIATAVMLTLFGATLATMYQHGGISLTGIALLIIMGIAFVGGSLYLYAKMWEDED